MNKWKYKTLDQMGSVQRGRSKHRPRNDARLFGGQYPFIQTADVKNAPFYISEYTETYNEMGLAQSKLWDIGTLCITIAANIADTGILAIPACFPDSVLGFRAYDDISDVRFVKYCFDILQKDCKQISQGTAQDNLSWEKLSTIKFPCPPIEVQRKIADVLSAYDDLIENNRKQIKLLEEAAQRLYKEWFIDLRFPGHENTPIIDGIPEGWRYGSITDIAVCFDGKRIPLSSSERSSQKKVYPYYGAAACMDYVEKYIFDGIYLLFGEDGTVITNDGSPVLQYVWGKFWVNNHAHIFQGISPFTTEFLYMLCKHLKVSDVVTGVAQPKISQGRLNAKAILIPNNNLVIKYNKATDAIFRTIRNCTDQIKLLIESRDRLLPKLMTGELEVR